MVTATFGKATDDPRTIGKNIITVKTVTCKVYEPSSATDPIFILDYDADIFEKANYCSIGSPFNRFYFLSPFVTAPGGKMTVKAHVDVLETYKTSIQKLKPIISRRSGEYDALIKDDFITARAAADKQIVLFSRPVINTGSTLWRYVIEIIGSDSQ